MQNLMLGLQAAPRRLSVWTRSDPFRESDALVLSAFGATGRSFVPAAETVRDGDDAVIRLELPGLDLENDVTVEVDRGQLVVRGERRDARASRHTEERTESQDGRTLRELRYGSFYRSFVLPAHVTADAVNASYDKGILSVRIVGAYKGNDGAKRIAITAS
jgi:HSP20 family protein